MDIATGTRAGEVAALVRFAVMIGLCVSWASLGCQNERRESADPAPFDTTFVLPGAFSEQTTVADLEARFGDANVKVVSGTDGFGDWGPGVVLFSADPTRRAYVSFHDDETLSGIASISVRDAGSRWRGKHGVYIGMPLAELRELNGKPFGFSGFDSQNRGWAHDQWSPALDDEDAQLGNFDVGENEHMYFGIELGLRGPVADIPPDAYPHDEASLSSDDPRYPRLGKIVEVAGINATTSLDDEWN